MHEQITRESQQFYARSNVWLLNFEHDELLSDLFLYSGHKSGRRYLIVKVVMHMVVMQIQSSACQCFPVYIYLFGELLSSPNVWH